MLVDHLFRVFFIIIWNEHFENQIGVVAVLCFIILMVDSGMNIFASRNIIGNISMILSVL